MNLGEWALLLGAILTPVASIFGAWFTVRRMRASDKASIEVALKTVSVDEKEAHTHEVEMIIAGFSGSLQAVNAELKRTQDQYGEVSEKYGALTALYEDLKKELKKALDEITRGEQLRREMLRHIKALEEQIPDPPGPLTRPAWILSEQETN